MTHPYQMLAAPTEPVPPHERLGFSRERLSGVLRGMILARAVDDRLWQLSRQGLVHFVITSAGHEATQFGCALAIRAGRDYVVPYYRDLALGGEVAALIGEHAFEFLDGPVRRLGSPDVPATAFNEDLEAHFMLNPEKIAGAIRELAAY